MSLVLNGGFQAGDFSGWIVDNNVEGFPMVMPTGMSSEPAPNYAAEFRAFNATCTITQAINVLPNTPYTFSFYINPGSFSGGQDGFLAVGVESVSTVYYNDSIFINPTGGWEFHTVNFVTDSTSSLQIVFICPSVISYNNSFSIDNVSLTLNSLCYPAETLIKTITGENRATAITTDSLVLSVSGRPICPTRVVVSGPVERLVLIEKNLIAPGIPAIDLRLTRGHKVIIDGREIKAKNIKGARIFKVEPTIVYSLVFRERDLIWANGLPVVAFGEEDYLASVRKCH